MKLRGATCEEIALALDMKVRTVAARLNGLHKKGRVRDSGHRRFNLSKRRAIVWVKDDSPPERDGPHKTLTKRYQELKQMYADMKQKRQLEEDKSRQKDRAIEHCIEWANERIEGAEAQLRPDVNDILRGK
jgi:hypothetical protein